MVPQLYSWTCSACSLEWVLRSTGLNPGTGDIYADRERTVYEIGYPDQINASVGLTNKDGPGVALMNVLASYGQPSDQAWLGYDQVYELAQQTTGLMSGAAWFHWVGLRGVQGSNLWIANSAPNYMGVVDILSREDFNRMGAFSVVWLV